MLSVSTTMNFRSGYFSDRAFATFLPFSQVTLSPLEKPRYRISIPASRNGVNRFSNASSFTALVLATRPFRIPR